MHRAYSKFDDSTDLNCRRIKFMKESLNDLTSFNTLVLYILYSISKRWYLNQTLIIFIIVAWAINISLLIYSIFKIRNDQEAIEKSIKNWVYFKTLANVVYLYLTYDLINN